MSAISIVSIALTAFGLMPLVGQPRLSTDAFGALSSDLWLGLRESFVIATSSTILALIFGVPAGLALVSVSRIRAVLAALTSVILPVPHLIGAASVGLLLSGGGVLPRWLGVAPSDWPALVAGSFPTAIVIEFAWKESAFVAFIIAAALSSRLTELSEAAAVLGAGPWQRLRRVTLPMAAPSALAGAIIIYLYTLGSYEVIWLLGRSYPEALPVLAYRLFTSIDLAARPQAAAAALMAILSALAIAGVGIAALRRVGVLR
ncbi:ABC transporter permease [Ornithinimicrobium sp. INDO-MA30-4]|uniref:ABC transporter permease n=1 Tax=Ornithinimicrobium sp. INDO-MA30-4 TaxID=2908651 RepID=UPI001F2EA6CE|nr:ABC transporter permease subunit [Ornithinimicrobium sp. INDO-MA30-4]UJH69839.1 ABC transporter permease subunit [Ornithinimicrobium sp. INDO-MA30-4]